MEMAIRRLQKQSAWHAIVETHGVRIECNMGEKELEGIIFL
jgi:hypothetical protein